MSGSAQFRLSYEISPIVLCNGIAQNLPGGVLPIVSLLQAADFDSILSTGGPISLDDYFAHFTVPTGGTLIEYQIGLYPFANQAVAGNALIQQPLNLSMTMICPTRDNYYNSQAIIMSLKSSLDQHANLGGTYTVVTPKFPYTNGVLLRMVDVSTSQSHQAQNAYSLDFYFPLLTQEAAQAAQNALMSKLSNGSQIVGDPSWSGQTTNTATPSGLAGASIPAGGGSQGTNVGPLPTPPIPPPSNVSFDDGTV